MTKTIIVSALRLILSVATAGPAQAWPGHPQASAARGAENQRNAKRSPCHWSTSMHLRIRMVGRRGMQPFRLCRRACPIVTKIRSHRCISNERCGAGDCADVLQLVPPQLTGV